MASGLACIATRVSGTVDLIQDGETGFTYTLNEVDDLKTAFLRLAESADGFLENNSRLLIEEKFGLKAIAKRYENIYRELLS
jgi:glycosyltransferase involved in cell wall biosynthesis